jgi:ABC-2 type transport system permease protein
MIPRSSLIPKASLIVRNVRPYAALLGAGFARYSAYRAAMIGGAVTNAVFGLMRASVLVAAIRSRGGPVGGYDTSAAVTFAWTSQALIAVVEVFTWNELALRVRSGDVAVDLSRPVDLQFGLAAADLGRAAAVVLPRALPILLAGALTFGLAVPADPRAWALGLVSVLLATLLSFSGRFAVNLLAFWLVDVRGVISAYVLTTTLLSGLLVPVRWFPAPVAAVAAATPFPSMVQTPADVLAGHVRGTAALAAVGVQVAWLVVVGGLGRVVLRAAHRRLGVQGG